MAESGPAGRRTSVRTQIPPARLDSRHIFSAAARRLPDDQVRLWNQRNAALLSQYGLAIASVIELPLHEGAPIGAGAAGFLQGEARDRLLLTAMLGALSVAMSGRGDLLTHAPSERDRVKQTIKENNDRNSTAAMTEALHALCDAADGIRLKVAIGEGARLKPGEKGGNPTLYAGQIIGAGPAEYSLAVDTVEGTTKSTLFDHSCGTLLYITQAPIAPVPDVYFDKCQLFNIADVTVADPLDRIVQSLMDARGTREVNLFALDRPRHPIDRMLTMGANMRVDTDGDAYPVVASGLAWGVFPDNFRPLDGVCGNIGGAAEMIASAAGARYLGVRSTARFCASRIRTWEERYDLTAEDEEEIRSRGFDPGKVYSIEDLVPGLTSSDGAFIAAAIADNWHVPGLDAVYVGGNFADISAAFVGAGGAACLYRVTFTYQQSQASTAETLTPVLTRLLGLTLAAIPRAVREAVADPARARRLRHEVATSYYMHILPPDPTEINDGRMRLNMDAAAKVESAEAMAFLRAILSAAPDWFA